VKFSSYRHPASEPLCWLSKIFMSEATCHPLNNNFKAQDSVVEKCMLCCGVAQCLL